MEEYVDHQLTDSTDDATELLQAEISEKLKRKEKGRRNNMYNPYYKNQDNSDNNTSDLFRGSSPIRQGETSGVSSRNTYRHVYAASDYYGGKKAERDNKCFYCNTEGHWAYQCPRKSRVPKGKSY